MKRQSLPSEIPGPSLPKKVCQQHIYISAPGLCPICLIEERDRLQREVEKYREWLGMDDEQ